MNFSLEGKKIFLISKILLLGSLSFSHCIICITNFGITKKKNQMMFLFLKQFFKMQT